MLARATGGQHLKVDAAKFQAAVAKWVQRRNAAAPAAAGDAGAAALAGESAAPAGAPPAMTPDPSADGAAQAGVVTPTGPVSGFPDTMGLTTWKNADYKSPSLTLDSSGKGKDWKTKMKKTTSTEGTPTAVATK